MSQRTDDKSKGISKITFIKVYIYIKIKFFDLPGLLSDRLFSVFDINQKSFINFSEFTTGMNNLYSGSFEKLLNLIFEFYDFDKDGKISKEDIRIVLSYIPLKIMDEKIQKYKGLKFKK